MTKLTLQTDSTKSRPAPSISSTVFPPENRPSYNEWSEGIRAELHTAVPAHRQPLKWHLNSFKNEKSI